jgi:hypothetical protein
MGDLNGLALGWKSQKLGVLLGSLGREPNRRSGSYESVCLGGLRLVVSTSSPASRAAFVGSCP